jgi:hypothetical protein
MICAVNLIIGSECNFSLAQAFYAWGRDPLPTFNVNPVYGIPVLTVSVAPKAANKRDYGILLVPGIKCLG